MNFTMLIAILTVYEHNMRLVHWGIRGKKFDRIHKLAEDYTDLITKTLDWAAESGMRIDENPISYDENLKLLESADDDYLIMPYAKIGTDAAMKYIMRMLNDIQNALLTLHETDIMNDHYNIGIKATLESYIEEYDLQTRFLHKSRMECCEGECD